MLYRTSCRLVAACLADTFDFDNGPDLSEGLVCDPQDRPQRFNALRLTSFMAGLVTLWLAIGSPLDGFADVMLSVHMVEHLLLMSVVPPLLLFGCPVVPLLRGMPRAMRRPIISPLIRASFVRRLGQWVVHSDRRLAGDESDISWLACPCCL